MDRAICPVMLSFLSGNAVAIFRNPCRITGQFVRYSWRYHELPYAASPATATGARREPACRLEFRSVTSNRALVHAGALGGRGRLGEGFEGPLICELRHRQCDEPRSRVRWPALAQHTIPVCVERTLMSAGHDGGSCRRGFGARPRAGPPASCTGRASTTRPGSPGAARLLAR